MPPKKATGHQYKTLVSLVKECTCIRWGKGTPDQKKEAWENISSTLNAIGGVEKNAEGWKKAYTEMKSHVKAKIRAGKTLNEVETNCAEISGVFISCFGLPDIPELGGNIETLETGILIPEVSEPTILAHDTDCLTPILPLGTHPEVKLVLDEEPEETQAEANPEGGTQINKKKIGTRKKPDKSMQLLLNEHISCTNKGLQDIAMSIQAVAEAINNVALAIHESNPNKPT